MNSLSRCFGVVQLLSLALVFPVSTAHGADVPEAESIATGRVDATSLIQRLVDERKGLVELPSGRWLISKTIEINLTEGHCAIRGNAATVIVMSGDGPAFRFRGSHFKSADPNGFGNEVWQRERMPVVQDLAIEGTHEKADGIEAIGTMQLTVSQVHLRKLRHGIRLVENNRNVVVTACHIYENSGVGIFYDDVNLHQSNIVGCHISYCGRGGIVSRKGNVRNIHITGCDIESNMSAMTEPTANVFIDCRGSNYGTAEVAITGCTIQHNDEGPKSANIRIIGSSDPRRSASTAQIHAKPSRQNEGHVTITGNVLSDVHTNVWLDGCRGVTLTGNTFWMGFEHNLLVENSSHIVVGPNNFDRNPRYAYGRSLEAKNQLVFRDSRDCTLTGLHVTLVQNSPAAISFDTCERFHISGITILDSSPAMLLRNVRRSRFANIFAPGSSIRIEGGKDNSFDDSAKLETLAISE